ncbi:hypothetical protein [Paenibacillus agricola]|uniref:Uncharacterized protein n=1 Tax=Paenibacillus agricola TaxID=2716264 RepID=A0ABX0JDI1_9BACL|nr:hypothetical protein [Paenibacillus agricola]NHN33316.1 hypothetical protein [Paenibacillus agricola]
MNRYILSEFEGITCVAKKSPFTIEERLYGISIMTFSTMKRMNISSLYLKESHLILLGR